MSQDALPRWYLDPYGFVLSLTSICHTQASDGSSLRMDALRAQRPVTLPQRPSRLDPSADRSRLGNAGMHVNPQPLRSFLSQQF